MLKTVPQTQDRPDSKLTLDTNGVSKIVLGINLIVTLKPTENPINGIPSHVLYILLEIKLIKERSRKPQL